MTNQQTHESVVVHDITGKVRNLLHQVSVPRDSRGPEGFVYLHGWVDRDGTKWDLYTKRGPV